MTCTLKEIFSPKRNEYWAICTCSWEGQSRAEPRTANNDWQRHQKNEREIA